MMTNLLSERGPFDVAVTSAGAFEVMESIEPADLLLCGRGHRISHHHEDGARPCRSGVGEAFLGPTYADLAKSAAFGVG